MRDGDAENAATFDGSATVVDFDLLYRHLRELPRAIANARWISRTCTRACTLHLRTTSSFNLLFQNYSQVTELPIIPKIMLA